MSGAPATEILTVCRLLERGRLEQAVASAKRLDGPVVRDTLIAIGLGLLAEKRGDTETAHRLFEQAHAGGVPLPAPLRLCGRYFKRAGDWERALACYAVLAQFDDRAMDEFARGLPADATARYAPSLVRRLHTAARVNRPRLATIKHALVERLGAPSAAIVFAEMCRIPAGEVTELPLVSLRDFAREQGVKYEEISPGRTITPPPLPVSEGETPGRAEVRTRTIFRCVLADAVVSSQSNFLIAGGRALLDYQDDELERLPLDLAIDPIVSAATRESVFSLARASDPVPLNTALALVGVSSSNYWHWLMEFLPRVLVWRGQPGFDEVPIIVDHQIPEQYLEALRTFAGRDGPFIVLEPGKAVAVKRLLTASMFVNIPHFPRAGVPTNEATILDAELLAQQLAHLGPALEELEVGHPGADRIFLTRPASPHRGAANMAEVENWFQEHGFKLVEMGELSFVEQVQSMRGARVVVGTNGAALANMLFARPGTRIGVLDNEYFEDNLWYALVAAALDLRLNFLTGKVVEDHPDYSWNASFRIDVTSLPIFLETLLEGPD